LIKTAKDVEKALLDRIPEHQLRPRLEPTARAAAMLGDPQKLYRIVHVTGTNGKTSTSRMIERLLREHSLRTGRFTSPHLTRINERIAIDGESVSDEIMVEIWNDIEPILGLVDAELDAEGESPLTYFEALTLLAFAIFADAPVDVLVLEVGMGGEWDSTNVADGDVAVFTPIDLDHTDRLGKTVAEIAKTKSGIIKPSAVVVSATQEPTAMAELQVQNQSGRRPNGQLRRRL
jgi:dihydrofolate synthase / folylpolyglutamate synthase